MLCTSRIRSMMMRRATAAAGLAAGHCDYLASSPSRSVPWSLAAKLGNASVGNGVWTPAGSMMEQLRHSATTTTAAAPSGDSGATTDDTYVSDSPDMSVLIGVGWPRAAPGVDEHKTYADEIGFFCARTKRTLTLKLPAAAKAANPKVIDPEVVAFRAAVMDFCDLSFEHLERDTHGVVAQSFQAVAVFLSAQNDATAAALQIVLTMFPQSRAVVHGTKTVRAHYISPVKDAWSMLYSFFVEQRRVVKQLPVPQSLFDAYATVASATDLPDASVPEAQRWAILAVKAPMAATHRFAGPGAFTDATSISLEGQVAAAVVARVIPRVRVFSLAITQKNVSVAEKNQLWVSIYYGAKKQVKNVDLSAINDEKKLVEIIKFICRPSTLTVLVPTAKTSDALVKSLMRHLRTTNPTYVVPEAQLIAAFGGTVQPAKSTAAEEGSRDYFTSLAARFPGGVDSLLTSATILARDRFRATSGSMVRVQGLVPLQANPSIAQIHANAQQANLTWTTPASAPAPTTPTPQTAPAASALPPTGVPIAARRTTLADPVLSTADMKLEKRIATKQLLDDWNALIYANPSREAKEQAAIDQLQRWLVLDLETTTRAEYKRRANPFIPHNRVVLPGFLDYKGNMIMPKKYLEKREDYRLPDLSDYQVIVGHNIKFDLHYSWRDPELIKFFERGGRIWDTMYGEYLLSGHYLKLGKGAGLEDVARSYGGTTPKLDAVKEAWAAGKDTTEIDYNVLAEYLEGDLRNTALIFEKQRARAYIQRQAMIINARMDSLLCTTEMEFNGLRIDRELAAKQERELEAKCTTLKKAMDDMIPTAVPWYLRRQFNWSSYPTLAAMIFGGKIEFNEIEKRTSPRSALPMYSSLNDVSVPAQLAWLANCLGPKVVKTYTELYLRECGLRTNNVYADAFDTTAIENKFDLYHYAAKTSLDSTWEDFTTGKIKTFPGTESDEMKQATLSEFAMVLNERKIGFKYIVGKSAVSKPKTVTEHGFKTTVYTGPIDGFLPALREFLLATSGDGTMLKRRTIVLGRRNADYVGILLNHLGLTPKWMAECVPVNPIPNASSKSAAVAADSEDGEGGTLVRPVAEPAVSLGDDLVVLDHASWYFPESAAAAVAAAEAFITSKAPSSATAAGGKKSKAKKLAGSKKDAAASAVIVENQFIASCGGDVLQQAIASGIITSTIAEGITNEYTTAKAAIGVEGASKLESKRRAAPKRKVAANDLDLRFEVKGLANTVYLDRGFETVTPQSDPVRHRELLAIRHLGAIINTHDVFLWRLDQEPLSEVPIVGRLETFVKDATEREELVRKFTSEETGKLQVGEATLSMLQKKGDKLCETILDLRGMEKLLSTYYDEKRTGMMALVHSYDSCIHHELQHNNTSTGRLASRNPNCQNIPKEDKSELRDLFISRFTDKSKGEYGYCIEADYSQLEVVTLCALSHDVNMTTDLKNKVDFHCKRVTMMHPHLTYEEVVQKAKKDKLPEFVKMRSQAKIFSFQRQYGAGVKMLSESTGLSHETIRKLIDNEAKTYYGVDQFYDMVTLSCNAYDPTLQDGARNKYGDQIFKGSFAVLSGSRYVFTESDMPKAILDSKRQRNYNPGQPIKTTTFSPTHLKNYPVQGFAGEIVQVMLGKLWRHFVAKKNYGGKALLTNTVHDCVWVDARKEMVKEVAKDVDSILSSAREVLNEMYPEMRVEVDFPVDVVAGTSMGHVKPLKALDL